jgi:hypothetical protein
MAEHRDIDDRDIDQLLSALTDRQIASLFGMSEAEVYDLRQSRLRKHPAVRQDQKSHKPSKSLGASSSYPHGCTELK